MGSEVAVKNFALLQQEKNVNKTSHENKKL